jgi:phage shock protein E
MSPDAIIVVVLAAAVAVFFASRSFLGTLSSADARRWVSEGARLVDVRSPSEYASGHIEGAVNIPVQELPTRVGELGRDKARPIVVYCRSGSRSAHAKRLLEHAGFAKVGNLGPMSRW